MNILALALEMGVNPGEIFESWDVFWINRLLQYINARALARQPE